MHPVRQLSKSNRVRAAVDGAKIALSVYLSTGFSLRMGAMLEEVLKTKVIDSSEMLGDKVPRARLRFSQSEYFRVI